MEFGGSQINDFSVAPASTRAFVQYQIVNIQSLGSSPDFLIGPRFQPACKCSYPGHEFACAERLGKIIIGSVFQPCDSISFLTTGCEHQHADGGAASQLVQHLQAR